MKIINTDSFSVFIQNASQDLRCIFGVAAKTKYKLVLKAIILIVFTSLIYKVNAQSASTTVSGSTYWSAASWSTASGGSVPTTDGGTYAESVTVNGLGNGETFYVDLSLTVSSLTLNASGSNPTLRVTAGHTLHITGDLLNPNNNVTFYVEAGAALIVDGTLNGNQNNLFGGSGTISGGTLNLGNNAGCSGTCPTISFTNCTAGGSFCTNNNNNCTAGTWFGITSSDWNTASNWCGGVPTSTTNVTIPSGTTYSPIISAAGAVCNNLTVSSGASVTITSPGTLTVSGNIVNNATISGTGTLTMGGSAAQTLSGTAGSYGNITINNSSGVTASSTLTITGILTLTSGTFTSGGNVTVDLNSGAIAGSGSGSLSGNVNIKKSVSSTGFHYLAAPIAGITPSQFADDVYLSTMYSYNETVVTSDSMQGWASVTNFGSSMAQKTGYALYLASTGNINLTGTYSHSSTYSFSLTHTNSNGTNLNTGGWNLIGNPYPSAIDWSASSGLTKTGIDNSIYYWNPATNSYGSYVAGIGTNGATQYIPSMQSVFVHVSSVGTGTIGMTNSVRVTSNNPSLLKKSAISEVLRLKLSGGNSMDETIIRLNDDATNSFDGELDAYKMLNDSGFNLYTHVGGTDYSINSLPETDTVSIIPVTLMVSSDGNYSIDASGLESFDSYSVKLIDSLLNVTQDLKANPKYSIPVSQGTSRKLYIGFEKLSASSSANVVSAATITSTVSSAKIGGDGSNVIVQFNGQSDNATIIILDIFGHEVYKVENISTSQTFSSPVPVSSGGLYIVKVETDGRIYSGKVFLNR